MLGNRILSANFRAADGSPKMLTDLILHSKRHNYLSLQKQKELISPLVTKVRRDVSPKKSLAFTAIKSDNLQ